MEAVEAAFGGRTLSRSALKVEQHAAEPELGRGQHGRDACRGEALFAWAWMVCVLIGGAVGHFGQRLYWHRVEEGIGRLEAGEALD